MMGHLTVAFLGGTLIGGAAIAYFLFLGRIAGISGIAGRLSGGDADGSGILFLAGMVLAPCVWRLGTGDWPGFSQDRPWFVLVVAGLLVGCGTQMARGCTSGHGVIGLARLSRRSFVAVLSFMTVAIVTATLSHFFGH